MKRIPNKFYCPCHDGLYTKDGKNVEGTPPTRPLDRYAQRSGRVFGFGVKPRRRLNALNRIYNWVDERLDITPLWRDIADHEVPEHVNPAHHFSAFVYCFGGLTFFIVVIQILSGMFLAMYYVPDIENAWQSVYDSNMKSLTERLSGACTIGERALRS